MKGRPQIERIELFGDIHKIEFDPDRKKFQGVGRVSPTDVSRLLDKVAEHYAPAKSKEASGLLNFHRSWRNLSNRIVISTLTLIASLPMDSHCFFKENVRQLK